MPTEITQQVNERSTAVFTVDFFNESGARVVPARLTWSLVDANNNVINGREQVNITPAASVHIVLSGADLQIVNAANTKEYRWLVVEGTYASTYGAALSLKDEVKFVIRNLHYVPGT
jgi:hypothetical protein